MKKKFRGEDELLQGINERNKDALAQLRKYANHNAIFIAWKIVKNDLDAEEIANDAFIKFKNSRIQFNSLQHAKNYLYRITKNLSINFKKSRAHVEWESLSEAMADVRDDTDIEASIAEREVLKELNQQKRKLPENLQLILQLMNEGKTTAEIASTINKDDQYVRNRKSDIIKFFKKIFKPKR